ncbi:MAG: 3',5'-cyclic-AMP phosphodiesterase [Gammaproteobacteria bacterium]|nr:3',5'-cyclic-AMP phosphodiesterase [Gammaproteobacteria bacterium]
MDNAPIRIIQISDMHLFSDPESVLLGIKTQESFQAVLELLQQEAERMDLILLTGDLSQDGSNASYVRLASMMKKLHVPVYCVPGNHDNTKIMNHVYPLETISNLRHIILKNWHLILLDSQKPGAVEGYLDHSQLNYLRQCLQTYPEHEAIVVLHHHPLSVGSRWLDNLGLKNAEEFWSIISQYPKMNTILFGHIHQEHEQMINGISCYSTPSTCVQFMRKQDKFGLEKLPAAYRWINLYEDGHLETAIKRVANYIGIFDANAKGY